MKCINFFELVIALFFLSCIISINACQSENTYKQGKILYENFCSNCHMDDGTGLESVIPTLVKSDYLEQNQSLMPCIIKNGLSGKIIVNGTEYDTVMPGSPKLTEFEITNVINYINTAWGNDYPIQKHLDVRKALEACE